MSWGEWLGLLQASPAQGGPRRYAQITIDQPALSHGVDCAVLVNAPADNSVMAPSRTPEPEANRTRSAWSIDPLGGIRRGHVGGTSPTVPPRAWARGTTGEAPCMATTRTMVNGNTAFLLRSRAATGRAARPMRGLRWSTRIAAPSHSDHRHSVARGTIGRNPVTTGRAALLNAFVSPRFAATMRPETALIALMNAPSSQPPRWL